MVGVLRAKHEDWRSNANVVVGLIHLRGVYVEGNKNNTSYKTNRESAMKLLKNKDM
jgi:hypothetical protein